MFSSSSAKHKKIEHCNKIFCMYRNNQPSGALDSLFSKGKMKNRKSNKKRSTERSKREKKCEALYAVENGPVSQKGNIAIFEINGKSILVQIKEAKLHEINFLLNEMKTQSSSKLRLNLKFLKFHLPPSHKLLLFLKMAPEINFLKKKYNTKLHNNMPRRILLNNGYCFSAYEKIKVKISFIIFCFLKLKKEIF